MKSNKIFDTPEGFYNAIPTQIQENIKFRIELHALLATDKTLQQIFLELCRRYYPIFFSSTAWTLNPQLMPGERNQPFILRPAQIPAVERLNWCIDNKRDVGIDKTRKQGASELCAKLFVAKCLLEELSHFILGSRKKELVDCAGDPTTLMGKCDNALDFLPSWWKKKCGYDAKNCRKDMQIVIPETGSSIQGETTNESFSAGSRASAICLDEFGRVEKVTADAIEGSIHDVADCVIYSSTHWLGINHTFNRCLKKPTTEVIRLLWYDNPVENYGLYQTKRLGEVDLVDEDWWLKHYPELKKYAETE